MNNKKEKVKGFILKLLIVLEFVIFGLVIACIFIPSATESLIKGLLIALLVNGGFFVVLAIVFGLKPKVKKAEKFLIKHETYQDVESILFHRLSEAGYQKYTEVLLDNGGRFTVFARKKISSWLCFVIVHTDELTEDILDEMNSQFKKCVQDYHERTYFTGSIFVTSLVCVHRVTPVFYQFVNTENQNTFEKFEYHAGISFDEKMLHAASPTDGLGVTQTKKMKKEFLDILQNIIEKQASAS